MKKAIFLLIAFSLVTLSRAQSDNPDVKVGKLYLVPLPALAVNPAFGFIYGAALSGSMYLGDPSTTTISNGFLTATYSTKKQLVFTFKSNVYTRDNRWFFIGDWRLLFSSQPTYGLGTGPQSQLLINEDRDGIELVEYEDGVNPGELMEFNLLRFHQTALREVRPNILVGLGYHYDQFSEINDQLLDLESDPERITNHFAYSRLHGFDPEGYTISGPSVNAVYDARDNINSPYEGRFAFAQFKVLPEALGSDRDATMLWLEYRDYFSVSRTVPRNLIGVWSFFNLTTSGQLPYMGLPAIGWDQLAKSGRAYPQGRWRGENLFYIEVEYRTRLPIWKKHPDLLGAAVFANATSTSAKDLGVRLFEYFQPGFGAGLRIQVQKEVRSNVGIDYGIGRDGKGALYFTLNEYF